MATIDYSYIPPKACLDTPEMVKRALKNLDGVGGFDLESKAFTPLKLDKVNVSCGGPHKKTISGCDVFVTVSAAIEAGIVDDEMWPTQLFANEKSFDVFVETLSSYEECYKLIDPWWSAIRALVDSYGEEEGYSTASDLADRLAEALDDLPKQWPKAKAKTKA